MSTLCTSNETHQARFSAPVFVPGNRSSAVLTSCWIVRLSPRSFRFLNLGTFLSDIFFSSVCDPGSDKDTKDECND